MFDCIISLPAWNPTKGNYAVRLNCLERIIRLLLDCLLRLIPWRSRIADTKDLSGRVKVVTPIAVSPTSTPQPIDPEISSVGIKNIGNSCYLNAMLQSVVHCPALVQETNPSLSNPIDLFMSGVFQQSGTASEVFRAAIEKNDVEGAKALARYIDFEKIDLDSIPLENTEIITYLADQVKDKKAFYNHLEERWAKDNQPNGAEALQRIRECRRLRSEGLKLSCLGLKTFPFFLLRELPNLERLNLSDNQLTSFTITPGALPALIYLGLSYNLLTTFSATPGALPALIYLDLSSNRLTTFSATPGAFPALKNLVLSKNQLTSLTITPGALPALISLSLFNNQLTSFIVTPGTLPALQDLDLSSNRLTTFSATPGAFPALMILNLYENQLTSFTITPGALPALITLSLFNNQLHELPLSLQDCRLLTDINVDDALRAQADSILRFVQEARGRAGLVLLPAKVEVWKVYSGLTDDFSFIAKLSDEDKKLLYEWLHRLEYTQEFKSAQKNLAEIVCKILASLNQKAPNYHKEFAESFYIELLPNLERCGDRAAETLNLIYASWMTWNLPKKVSDKEKLEILVKAAKAFALTKGIANKLKNQPDQEENVEVYLFYKVLFSDRVLTAVKTMLYPRMGDRRNNPDNPITEAELQKFIDENYWNELTDLIPFKNLILKNKEYFEEFNLYLAELEKVSTLPSHESSLPLLKEAEGFPTKEDKTLYIQKQLMIKHAKIKLGI